MSEGRPRIVPSGLGSHFEMRRRGMERGRGGEFGWVDR